MINIKRTNNKNEFITLDNGDEYCIFDIEQVEYLYGNPTKSKIYFNNCCIYSSFNLLELISKLQHFNIKLNFDRGHEVRFQGKRQVQTKFTNCEIFISEEEREYFKKQLYRTNRLEKLLNK